MSDKTSHRELNTQLELVQWYQSLIDTNNKAFMPLFFDSHRYLVLKGGGGSGKSVFAARKVIERCVSERKHRFLVCRKVGRTIRESCFRLIVGHLSEYYPDVEYKANLSDMKITFPATESEIIFSGLDDVEKLKSIYNITGIWIEEASELLEGDFNQLNIRLRGETLYYKQIIISFNPISLTHWLKARFFDRDLEDCTISETTYKDNRFLDEENIRVLEDYKYTDPYYYQVYCLGQWGVTGQTVFDGQSVTERLVEVINSPAPKRGMMAFDYDGLRITDEYFLEDPNGYLRIYEEPQDGVPYVVGVDTAGDGSDACVIHVLNALTLNQAAVFRAQNYHEDLFARQIYAVGMWYNRALVAVESNYSTYPILELERLRYPKQYVREVFDDATHKIQLKYGFQTNSKTRPAIISKMQMVAREHIKQFNDRTTLEEMLTFVRNPETFKAEAEEGAHDDTVLAMAIALQVRDSGQITLVSGAVGRREKRKWTPDMWEDYNNASSSEKKMLIERWGEPRK